MKVRKKELVKLIETIIDKRLNEKTEISLVTKVSEAMAEGLVLDSIRDWIEAIDISTEDYDEYEILNEIYSGLLSKIKPFLKSIEKKYNKNLKAGSGLDLSNTKITRLPKNLKVGSKTFKEF